jgi:hypothetical protein
MCYHSSTTSAGLIHRLRLAPTPYKPSSSGVSSTSTAPSHDPSFNSLLLIEKKDDTLEHVRFTEKPWLKVLFADWLWEKNTVSAKKTSWKLQIIRQANMKSSPPLAPPNRISFGVRLVAALLPQPGFKAAGHWTTTQSPHPNPNPLIFSVRRRRRPRPLSSTSTDLATGCAP